MAISLSGDGAVSEGARGRARKRSSFNASATSADRFELTPELAGVFDLMERSNRNLFITGRAGTGKSALLQYFREKTRKKTVVVAPTGIAAINVGGSTIHSFFRFPLRLIMPGDVRVIQGKKKLFESLEMLLVDEVSMVRSDMLDAIDVSLRLNRGRPEEPFGGVQVVLIGDLHQLPPVVEPGLREFFEKNLVSPYFFSAAIFRDAELATIELRTVFRQVDPGFIRLLDRIRNREIDEDDLEFLNTLHDPSDTFGRDDLAVTLTSTNKLASDINRSRLEALHHREYMYEGIVDGDFEKSFPAEKELRLRRGAQVMMVKNDPAKRWVNGTLGIVEKLSPASITVRSSDGSWDVEPAEWEKIDYEFDPGTGGIVPVPVGSFRQYPIKLAWAMTVHKSQGKTFDRVIIDLGRGAFAHGQSYVALSRCRSFQGIRLRRPLRPSDLILDERVVEFLSR